MHPVTILKRTSMSMCDFTFFADDYEFIHKNVYNNLNKYIKLSLEQTTHSIK